MSKIQIALDATRWLGDVQSILRHNCVQIGKYFAKNVTMDLIRAHPDWWLDAREWVGYLGGHPQQKVLKLGLACVQDLDALRNT